jgi:hypothetical protein
MENIDVSGGSIEARGVMIRVVLFLLDAVRALVRQRSDLVLENLALRQQVAALAAKGGRPRITTFDRWLWITLRRCWSRWVEVLVFVKPETVVRCIAQASVVIGPGCRDDAVGVDHGPVRTSAH